MLSMDCTCKNVHILQLAKHARKFVPVCSAFDEIGSAYAQHAIKIVSVYDQHTHAIIFENDSKIPN
jgi:hypothetical protein